MHNGVVYRLPLQRRWLYNLHDSSPGLCMVCTGTERNAWPFSKILADNQNGAYEISVQSVVIQRHFLSKDMYGLIRWLPQFLLLEKVILLFMIHKEKILINNQMKIIAKK